MEDFTLQSKHILIALLIFHRAFQFSFFNYILILIKLAQVSLCKQFLESVLMSLRELKTFSVSALLVAREKNNARQTFKLENGKIEVTIF